MTDRVGLARLYMVWPTPRQFTAEDAELDVLAHVLAGGKTSRLYRALVREKQIAQDVQAYQDGQELTGEFVDRGHGPARPHAGRNRGGRGRGNRAASRPSRPRPRRWPGPSTRFESHMVRSLEPVSEFGGRADRLNMYNVLTGDPGYMAKDFARYVQVDARRRSGGRRRKYLGTGPRGGRGGPGQGTDDHARSAASRPTRPARSWPKRLPPPPPVPPAAAIDDVGPRRALPSRRPGARVPPAADPAGPPLQRHGGAAGREARAAAGEPAPGLSRRPGAGPGRAAGAGRDDGRRLGRRHPATHRPSRSPRELAGIGASLSMACDWDTTSARLFTLKRHLAKALDIYADVLRNPAFPQAELERQRAMAAGPAGPDPQRAPGARPDGRSTSCSTAPEHPYGHPQWGSPAVLERITPRRPEARSTAATMRPEQAGLIAVGDITMAELTADVGEGAGRLEASRPAAPRGEPSRLSRRPSRPRWC